MLQPVTGDREATGGGARARPRVLFLCTGNSARSQIGEALLRHLGGDRFEVLSAGSNPRPTVHPLAREVVKELFGVQMTGQYAKRLDSLPGPFDWIIAVCDDAADSCPVLPATGRPLRWSLEDPAKVTGSEEKREAFRRTALDLHRRIEEWLSDR